ncbi:TOTE conflict system archaeo-eukaryotic primase domain-containing protein [Oceanobacillus saliphilus]|uniref:TOTE conflict system archaeo-eukaryotic primase domain-containing protein n=1 Tax=Oceanobacillus saliphilus TaxID=2925834 RepID=UPI00201DE750|nr:DEAD/DEAH box helicase [Oceanobacillus saliphilus]
MEDIEQKLVEALEECKRLKGENYRLKQLLKQYQVPSITNKEASVNTRKQEILKERLELFRNLFKGREDVYAVRWEYENGKAGYSPATFKKGENKNYLPITDKVIYEHLSGKKIIGVYPMLKNETCWFLAVDFDKTNWEEDVRAFMDACNAVHVPASIERSRSGNGGHVWIFFNEAIPAHSARKLGNFLLTYTLNRRYQVGFDSYDRMFPNQDTLPKGGFGNLIALPLQRYPRESGNSIFVDYNFNPYPDQWEYLSKIKKLSLGNVEKIIGKKNQIGPFTNRKSETIAVREKQPSELNVVYKNGIIIPKTNLPPSLLNKIIRLATFNNPNFFKAEANRLSTYNIPRVIDCADILEDYFILPRGCLEELKEVVEKNGVELRVKDESNLSNMIDVEFYGQLTAQQDDAVNNLLNHRNGILSAPTGFGKTVVAASLISKRKVNTLVIVHTKQLIDQWRGSLSIFLKIDAAKIGQIGGGKNKANGQIDIATIQSLNYKGIVKDVIKDYGQIIVDECHHISAFSFENVLKKAEASYVHGLTATPTRKDGLQPIMKMQCGPIRYKISAKNQAKVRPFQHILVPRKTTFKSKRIGNDVTLQELYKEMIHDENRNELIFNDVLKELEMGSSPIILSERVEQVEKFEKMFTGFAKNIFVLTGGMKKSEEESRLKKLQSISDDKERLIIATGKYIGEGFDHAVLDTLFLAMPISWEGTLLQYVGRIHRIHDSKNAVKVYDYVDHREETFRKMFEKRKKGYKSMGYIEHGRALNESNEQMKLF